MTNFAHPFRRRLVIASTRMRPSVSFILRLWGQTGAQTQWQSAAHGVIRGSCWWSINSSVVMEQAQAVRAISASNGRKE